MNEHVTYRRKLALLSDLNTAQLHLRNPWIPVFFSFSFPGFGYLLQQRFLKGFILIGWEFFINSKAHINLGILYSLLGRFQETKEVLDERWLMLYCGIYMFTIWDSYRCAVDMNKQYLLAAHENAPICPFIITNLDVNFLDKREPRDALIWSIIVPGLGHLYVHKVITGIFIFGFTITIMYYSHLPQAIVYTLIGNIPHALKVINMQWTLYLPSVFGFIFYDAYASAIEYNALFEKEFSHYLRNNYQKIGFKFPI